MTMTGDRRYQRGGTRAANGNGSGPVEPTLAPPASVEAEQATLGAAFISRPACEWVLKMLAREDFYFEGHRRVYDVIAGLVKRGEAPDVVTVPEELKRRGLLDAVGGTAYVNELAESVPTAAHVEHYGSIVLEKSVRRKLLEASGRIGIAVYDEGRGLEQVLEDARLGMEEVFAHRSRAGGLVVLSAPELMGADYPDPTWVVQGLLPQGVCILAGPPKAKKSFWSLGVALAVATGTPALGRLPVSQAPALCVFLEDRFPEVQERLGQFLGDEPAPEQLFIAQSCPRLGDGGEVWLDNWLADHPGTGLLVLDPLVRIRGGGRIQDQSTNSYEQDYRDMEVFKRLSDRHKLCVLVLHHTRKLPAEDWLNTLNSSTGLIGSADGIMLLQGERGGNDATLRATGRMVRDQELALQWHDRAGWTLLGEASKVAHSREQEEILEALRSSGRPLRLTHLVDLVVESTGAQEAAVKKRIQRMARRGLLMSEAGLYWAPDADSTPATGDMSTVVPAVPSVPPVSPVPLSPEGTAGTPGTAGTEGTPGTRTDADPAPVFVPDLEFGEPDMSDVPEGERETRLAAWRQQCELRQRVWRLAAAMGWPQVHLDNANDLGPGERPWRKLCHSEGVHPQWLERALKRLEALS